jgi:hypothetical protein
MEAEDEEPEREEPLRDEPERELPLFEERLSEVADVLLPEREEPLLFWERSLLPPSPPVVPDRVELDERDEEDEREEDEERLFDSELPLRLEEETEEPPPRLEVDDAEAGHCRPQFSIHRRL